MEYTYATLLLEETGEEIGEDNLTAVLEAAGADVSTSRVKALVAALEDVDVGEPGADSRPTPEPADEAAVQRGSNGESDADVSPDPE